MRISFDAVIILVPFIPDSVIRSGKCYPCLRTDVIQITGLYNLEGGGIYQCLQGEIIARPPKAR